MGLPHDVPLADANEPQAGRDAGARGVTAAVKRGRRRRGAARAKGVPLPLKQVVHGRSGAPRAAGGHKEHERKRPGQLGVNAPQVMGDLLRRRRLGQPAERVGHGSGNVRLAREHRVERGSIGMRHDGGSGRALGLEAVGRGWHRALLAKGEAGAGKLEEHACGGKHVDGRRLPRRLDAGDVVGQHLGRSVVGRGPAPPPSAGRGGQHRLQPAARAPARGLRPPPTP